VVLLRWISLGAGIRYQVYLRSPGGRYALVHTARSASVALTGLTRGRQYQVLIVPVNFRHRTGPAATWTITAR
jgi:hypothetical protein